MLKDLIKKQQKYIDHFFQHVDLVQAQHLVDLILECQGTVIFSGVGKSGIIAEKIAMTLTSTETKSLFLPPTNALHGDIGIVKANDLFVVLSKSGESEELLHLVPFLRMRGVRIVGVLCNAASRLAKICDTVVILPLEKELCPFDLVPTTSTAIQMIFGDLLAVALMQEKDFSMDQYAHNHPAGRIGKRLKVKVSDLMLKDKEIPVCKHEDKIVDILVELSNKRCGCILIIDENRTLQGIFTDGDLRRTLQSYGPQALDTNVGAVMSTKPRWINPDELAWKAVQLMESDPQKPITVLAVLDSSHQVLGVIKMHDIVQSGI
ncbi:MAG: KpsF/GutQ family sugar-phosphate isomerase [Parachlamydiales bacterium]|jgi:arabinose-5-phosphate isomerase